MADLMDEDAIDLVAERLRTPLQIGMHLAIAFEHNFLLAVKPVMAEIVEQVLSCAIDDLDPTLRRIRQNVNFVLATREPSTEDTYTKGREA